MGKKYYYKAMGKDMQCREFQFKVGETYTIRSEELRLCSDKVFHFCEKLEDTIEYYDCSTDRHFLIEVLGDIVTKDSKSGSNKIKVIRELSRDEIEEHIQDKTTLNVKKFLALYTTNIKQIEKLSKDEDEAVRYEVAVNLNTPVYLLGQLAKDKHWVVRKAVILNLNTTVEILEQLAKDKDEYIREKAQEKLKEITQ